jgi:hypothetical protein
MRAGARTELGSGVLVGPPVVGPWVGAQVPRGCSSSALRIWLAFFGVELKGMWQFWTVRRVQRVARTAAPTSALVSRRTPSSAKTQAFGGACECGGKSAGFSELCELGQKEGRLRECFRERPDDLLELLLHRGE